MMIDKHNSQDTNFNANMNFKRVEFGKPQIDPMHDTSIKECQYGINLSLLLG